MFKRTKVCAGVLVALGGTLAATSMPTWAQSAERIEITGSRIKRADSEGALPVTVITRAELEASGSVTVAEFIRSIPFSSAGNFRPQSGSSAQSFSEVDLRGLGSQRTLVLVDGRRVAKSPVVGTAADMGSIPMAAVERIEILTDGASAVYGSDAIGGVVNVVLRKDFQGVQLTYGLTKPSVKGGDREEASALFGMSGDKGRLLAGVSKTSRDIIYVRDYPWGAARGASTFSNNYFGATLVDGAYIRNNTYRGIAGTCDFADKGFYVDGTGAAARCRYDFNLVAADEASTSSSSVFARGEINIAPDWSLFLVASTTRNESFGRYAPVPDNILITPGSAGDALGVGAGGTPYFLAHRFAAGGNRDTSTDGNLYDASVGVRGVVANIDVEAGLRRTTNKVVETGRGFIVKELATNAINNGTYNVADPFAESNLAAIGGFTTTTGRDSLWKQSEIYANASMELFKMSGGSARLFVGAESRTETYADLYDSLSEAGQVLGSSGSSAGGKRDVNAVSTELLLPIVKSLEATLAARYEKYSDYGSDFSPKASLRFSPASGLVLRASAGRGFAAPSLPELTQKPAFSADSVVDERTCLADGSFSPAVCASNSESFQINGLVKSNAELTSEKSTQFALGLAWDITRQLSVKVDYWNTKIKDVISSLDAQDLVNRDNGSDPLPIPAGLSVTRDPTNGAIIQVVRGSANEGTVKYSGLDIAIGFAHSYGAIGSFRHDLSLARRLKADQNGTDFNGTFGEPKSRGQLANNWTVGPLTTTWNINYIGPNGGVRSDEPPRVASYVTHDLQLAWATPVKGLVVAGGFINVGEKLPQLISDNSKPFNYSLYDAYGRQAYVRASMKF